MSFFDLSNEIILFIAGLLEEKNLNSLLRSSRLLHLLLIPLLHKLAVRDKDNLPALCWAAEKGHEPLVQLLFEKGGADFLRYRNWEAEYSGGSSDPDASFLSSNDPGTPLDLAVRNGHTSIVAFLVWNGADVNALGWDIPLCSAARHGHDEILALLLDNGADIDLHNDSAESAISIAAEMGHKSCVKLLLERGANTGDPPEEEAHASALASAVDGGHTGIVLMLLDHGVEIWVEGFWSLLGHAVARGLDSLARLFVERGASIDTSFHIHSLIFRPRDEISLSGINLSGPILHAAVGTGRLSAVEILLDLGASIDFRRNDGETALSFTCRVHQDEIACLLLQRGADILQSTYSGTTVIDNVDGKTCPVFTKLLLDKLARTDNELWEHLDAKKIFFEAATFGQDALVQLLVDKGINVNIRSSDGETALHRAASSDHYSDESMVRLLLELGADVHIRDFGGRTALRTTAPLGRASAVRILREKERSGRMKTARLTKGHRK